MAFRKNKKGGKEETSTDRYLITYADLITLLLGLFVILYASSKIDVSKYKELSAAMSDYFKPREGNALEGGKGVLPGMHNGVPEPILPTSNKSLDDIYDETEKTFKDFVDKGSLTIEKSSEGIKLILPEKLLFKKAQAEVQKSAFEVMDSLAQLLKGVQYPITIAGHTDADPIRTFKYESNWHLSAARALNVLDYLIEHDVPEINLRISGYGAQRPIADNTTPEGKAKNRRVEIVINKITPEIPTTDGYGVTDSTAKKDL